MTVIDWDDSLSVNVVQIDNQHKQLVRILNQLFKEVESGKIDMDLSSTLHKLVEYTTYHFSTEENYFEKLNYELAEPHISLHNAFISKVGEFKGQLQENDPLLFADIIEYLVEWIVNHIKGADKAFTQCFNDNGVF